MPWVSHTLLGHTGLLLLMETPSGFLSQSAVSHLVGSEVTVPVLYVTEVIPGANESNAFPWIAIPSGHLQRKFLPSLMKEISRICFFLLPGSTQWTRWYIFPGDIWLSSAPIKGKGGEEGCYWLVQGCKNFIYKGSDRKYFSFSKPYGFC